MDYREAMARLNGEILSCPNYNSDSGCDGLTDVTHFRYKHGPEITFIGSKYGENGSPRILFTRLNRPWYNDVGWFGTKESIQHFKSVKPRSTISGVQDAYLKGWCHDDQAYRGIQNAGTVTGHPNKSKRSNEEKRSKPRYGVQVIMEEMIKRDVFPKKYNSSLDFCAINNIIKCSGKGKYYNPTRSMKKNCHFYEKELKILDPQVLIVMGRKAQKILNSSMHTLDVLKKDGSYCIKHNGRSVLYFQVPHPNGPGPFAWKGKDVKQFMQDNPFHEEFTTKKKCRYKTEMIFNYLLHLVWQIKQN